MKNKKQQLLLTHQKSKGIFTHISSTAIPNDALKSSDLNPVLKNQKKKKKDFKMYATDHAPRTKFKDSNLLKKWYSNLKTIQPEKFCVVIIKKTKNNTHCVINNLFGPLKTLWSTSGGVYCNKVNGRRKTRIVQRTVYKKVIDKILALGLQFLIIHYKGTTISKRFLFKWFSKHLTVLLIKDTTGVAHNGCRPPKIRRV